ncbi:MAG: hypothetical protein HY272_11505 [Gammaproteobacteria bacterium]|nr:hypothetical protein [Gammaproteobacteria bacterium]
MTSLNKDDFPVQIIAKTGLVVLLLLLLASPHIMLYDLIGMKLWVQIILGLAAVFLFVDAFMRSSIAAIVQPLAVLCLSYIVVEIVWRQDIKSMIGYGLAFFLVTIVSSFRAAKLNCFVKMLAITFGLFAVAGVAQAVIIYFIAPGLAGSIPWQSEAPGAMQWLGGADSLVRVAGIIVPRFTSYIQQASALPAYFLLPAAIVLVSSVKEKKLAYILIAFTLLSLSGSVMFCLGISVIVFFFYRYLHSALMVALPFMMFLAYVVILLAISSSGDPGQEWIKLVPGEFNYLEARADSGFSRMILASNAINHVFESPIFGMDSSSEEIFGSLIVTSGMRAGVIGMILAGVFFVQLFKMLSVAMKLSRLDIHARYGLALLYSIALQVMIYNDYGFSKFWGFVMFAIALATLRNLCAQQELRYRQHVWRSM